MPRSLDACITRDVLNRYLARGMGGVKISQVRWDVYVSVDEFLANMQKGLVKTTLNYDPAAAITLIKRFNSEYDVEDSLVLEGGGREAAGSASGDSVHSAASSHGASAARRISKTVIGGKGTVRSSKKDASKGFTGQRVRKAFAKGARKTRSKARRETRKRAAQVTVDGCTPASAASLNTGAASKAPALTIKTGFAMKDGGTAGMPGEEGEEEVRVDGEEEEEEADAFVDEGAGEAAAAAEAEAPETPRERRISTFFGDLVEDVVDDAEEAGGAAESGQKAFMGSVW